MLLSRDGGSGDRAARAGGLIEAPVAEDHLGFIDVHTGRVLGSLSLADELGEEQGVTFAQGPAPIGWGSRTARCSRSTPADVA